MLRYLTAGESHGKGLVAIIDGVPAGLKMDAAFINRELARRMAGYGRGGRMKIESDKAQVLSGCRKGRTIGSPVALLVPNRDYKIDVLPDVRNPRPGHADLAGVLKYGLGDARDVLERASARETAVRVASGAVAKLILAEFGIKVLSHVVMLGGIEADTRKLSLIEIQKLAERSDLRCADPDAAARMKAIIDKASAEGDTLGGAFEVIADGVPPGLGSYVQWDRRLDGALSRAVMSIPAVKAVCIGKGMQCAFLKGSAAHDPIGYDKKKKLFTRDTNNAGGIEGGVTNGMPVVIRGYMKPIATLMNALASVDLGTKKTKRASTERSDVTAVPACGVVAEAVVAIELASAFFDKFGGDSISETERNYKGYMKGLRDI
jgi:chorismate synthase